jgi:hypothetical protein
MSIDQFISSFNHVDWLAIQPLGPIASQYVESMQKQRYSALTIRHYLIGSLQLLGRLKAARRFRYRRNND